MIRSFTAILISSILVISCSSGSKNSSESSKKNKELNNASVILNSGEEMKLKTEEAVKNANSQDALQLKLAELKDSFFECIQKDQYSKAQDFLHPKGLYFYTVGKIAPKDFTLKTLQQRQGQLRGIYLYGGYGPAGNIVDTILSVEEGDNMEPKYVSGTYWLDSMLINFTLSPPVFHDSYHVEAYGSSGNYSSDHAKFLSDIKLFDNKPIIVMEIESNTIGYREELMVEFFQNDSNEWKIYAIGNKEWTP